MDENTSQPEPRNDAQATHRHLWAPWRMTYVGGEHREAGCVFCNRLAALPDVESYILWRTTNAFVLLNLYPYNSGHLMIVPNEHVASPELLSEEGSRAMAMLLPLVLRATRRALSCEGFNVGMNLGEVAGAGIAAHLHQHVVPRWQGDANFMPVIGATKVMPELLPVTYAKLRVEIALEAHNDRDVLMVAFNPARSHLLVHEVDGAIELPVPARTADEPAWLAARAMLADQGFEAALAGWAGAERADEHQSLALAFESTGTPAGHSELVWRPLDEVVSGIRPARHAQLVDNALARLSD